MLLVLAGHAWIHSRMGITSAEGKYLGADFINYWAGAHVAAEGKPTLAYNVDAFMAWQRAHSAANAEIKWYSYPPTALLLSLPLALLNFKPALIAWLMAGWALCAVLLKRTTNWGVAILAALATPASFINAISGQNGQYSAALLCGGILFLESNPLIAGMLLGLLCFKPHLAVLVPLALAAGGYWRAFLAAATTLLLTVGISWLLFGGQAWAAFLHNAPINTKLLEQDDMLWHRMPTLFAMVRLLGGSVAMAYSAQLLSAAVAITLTIHFWRGRAPLLRKGAVLLLATFLTTPYAWDYDLVSLTFAAVWLAQDGLKNRFLPWEKSLLALILVMPLILSPIGTASHLQIGPFILWIMLILALRCRPQRVGQLDLAVPAAG
jgi:hypothetical protein